MKEALLYVTYQEERLYYPYLLSSIAIVIALYAAKNKNLKGVLSYLFPLKRYWHIGTFNDAFLLILNHILNTVFVLPFVISGIKLGYYIQEIMNENIFYSSFTFNEPTLAIIYAVCFFVVNDFSRFYIHYLLHKIPFLWEFHKVHHSAEIMSPITLYRSHPVEAVLNQLRGILISGLVTGIFLWISPYQLPAYMVWGVHFGTFIFNLLGANLRHSHVWWSFGPKLEKLFISPAQHQIHHSNKQEHYDKNMGSELAVWDYLFKTLYITKQKKENIKFGISPEETKEHRNILSILFSPFRKIFK